MAGKTWMWTPHLGGKNIPRDVRDHAEQRIRAYANARYAGRFERIAIRFRGALCYIDAFQRPEEPSRSLLRATGETRDEYVARVAAVPIHLCRLRYFGDENRWTVALFTYSNEKYSPCIFRDGDVYGTPEGGVDVAAGYLLPEESGTSRGKTRGRPTRG
jgi:hypothetical protein